MAKKKQSKLLQYRPYIITGIFVFLGVLALILVPRLTQLTSGGCTSEALVCPDGSAVGRTGPKCTFAPCPALSPYKPVVLNRGSYGQNQEKLEQLAISDFTLSELFATFTSPVQDMAIPSVNWTQEVVVGVGTGQQLSGGYDVTFEKYDIDQATGKYRFYVTEIIPGNSCMSTEAITSPYEIAKFQIPAVEVTSKGYEFIYKETTVDCSAAEL